MRVRRIAGLAVPLTVGALALTACGSSGGGSSSSGGSGSGGGGNASKARTISIACQGPLTGDNAQLGINICDGGELAVDQANSQHALPFTLTLTRVDDQGSAANAPAAAQKILGDSSVVAVLGPAFSGATQASESFFAQAGLPSVTSSATLPSLLDGKNGFTTFYRAVTNDNAQGSAAAKYLATTLHARSVYSIDDAEAYGQGLAKVLESSLSGMGVKVTHDSVPQGTKQYESEASKVAGSGADAVYYSGYYADAGPLAKALRNAGYKGIFMSDDGTKDDNFVKLAGSAAEGAYFTCPCVDASKLPAAQSFVSAYKQKFNADPGTYSAESYDVANMLIASMKSLGSNVSRKSLLGVIPKASYKGITKTISFTSSHELANTSEDVWQVKNGQIVFLAPVS